MDISSTINALKEVIISYESAASSTEPSTLTRERLLAQLSSIVFGLERPVDAANRLWAQQMPAAIVKVAMESGLIGEMAKRAEQGSGIGHSADELAKTIDAEGSLIGRILRYLAAQGLVDEVDVGTFAANEKTIAFAGPGFQGCIEFFFDTISSVYQEIPAYFASRKYRSPGSVVDTVFQAGLKTPEPAFVWLQQHPQVMGAFMRYMTIQHHGKEDWLSLFPLEKELAAWTNGQEHAVFVDVGGGMGQQCIVLKQRYPQLQGRVVLQDLPEVIAHAELPPGIEKAAINFLENQPEKGAKFYYLRNILHDWPDKDVLTILKHIRDAMGTESRILIDELVVAAKGSPLLPVQMDIFMMLNLGAAERTLEQWEALLGQAGLKIENKYQYTKISADTLLVVVPK